MKAIITVGIPCSGKTTFAKEKCKDGNWINVNRDDIRFSIMGKEGWKDYKFNRANENIVTKIQQEIAQCAYLLKKNVIISDTNLSVRSRNYWTQELKALGYEVEIKLFPISLEEAYKRDALRSNGVGRDVIYDMYKKWLQYTGRKVYKADPALPRAVIFDVDGTLAKMSPDRGPYDWHNVHLDKPNEVVVDMFIGYRNAAYRTIVVSGRDGVCEKATKDWLNAHHCCFDKFYMRKVGDTRKDTIIKEEIFWNEIADNYNVVAVVDDRPVVTRNWREMGLFVIQVADPYVEF